MTPTVKNHQRDVSESLAQLCNCVHVLPWRVKLTIGQRWGRDVVYEDVGECVTEFQEQCEKDDVCRCDVVAGPSLDHRDDVEQLMGHPCGCVRHEDSQHK